MTDDTETAPVPRTQQPSWHKRPRHVENIDQALEDVQVHGPGCWENDLSKAVPSFGEWYAISTDDMGIIGYFYSEADALSFRLRIIDRWFNG